jgi:hypothetical protein
LQTHFKEWVSDETHAQKKNPSLGFTYSEIIGIKSATGINPSFTFAISLPHWGFCAFKQAKHSFSLCGSRGSSLAMRL